MAKKKKSTTKKLFTVVVVIVAILIVAGILAGAMGLIGGDNATSVETADAKLKTITQIVSASGKIQPKTSVTIRPEVSGKIVDLTVEEGDFVHKGDLLVRIKQDVYKAKIEEVNAMLLTQKGRLEQARANLIQAKSNYQQKKKLYEREVASKASYIDAKQNYEAMKASFNAAEAQVQSAQAQIKQAKEDLQKTLIKAPRSGTVTKLEVEEGEQVLGNARVAGTEMMHIAVMNNMEVQAEVNENDIVDVALGDTVKIEVDAYPQRTFEGIVSEISNSAKVESEGTAEQVTNYEVKVGIVTPHNLDMAGPDSMKKKEIQEVPDGQFVPTFKPGMTASVDIETETVNDAVAIPIQAVTVRNFADEKDSTNTDDVIPEEDLRKVVFLVKDGKVERRQVESGISDNTHIQIVSGVDVGDEVVIGPYRTLSERLKDGENVKIDNNKFAGFTAK